MFQTQKIRQADKTDRNNTQTHKFSHSSREREVDKTYSNSGHANIQTLPSHTHQATRGHEMVEQARERLQFLRSQDVALRRKSKNLIGRLEVTSLSPPLPHSFLRALWCLSQPLVLSRFSFFCLVTNLCQTRPIHSAFLTFALVLGTSG
jgi:hypothetical protein